jgi:hypothetical protein
MREIINPHVDEWENQVLESLSQYQQKAGASLEIGLEARSVDDEGDEVESVALFFDLIQRRRALAQKNRYIKHLGPILVTNE